MRAWMKRCLYAPYWTFRDFIKIYKCFALSVELTGIELVTSRLPAKAEEMCAASCCMECSFSCTYITLTTEIGI